MCAQPGARLVVVEVLLRYEVVGITSRQLGQSKGGKSLPVVHTIYIKAIGRDGWVEHEAGRVKRNTSRSTRRVDLAKVPDRPEKPLLTMVASDVQEYQVSS